MVKGTQTSGILNRFRKKTGSVNPVVNTVTGLREGRSKLQFPAGLKYFSVFS
jgi:hypothetical protein